MRRSGLATAWVFALVMGVGTARAAPMPVAVIGAWSDVAGCPANAHKMILADNEITVVENETTRHVLGVDVSGAAATRLEVRITRLPPESKADPRSPHLGDVLLLKLENARLQLVGMIEQGKLDQPPQPIVMERCG